MSSRPVFVGGSVRSGTTLLRVMLHAHPDIAVPREIHLTLRAFLHRFRAGNLAKDKNRAAFIDWMIGSGIGFDRLLVEESDARARLATAPPTIGSFVGTLLRLYAERHGASRFGEKRPLNINAHRALVAMFPNLQFIDIVRDPRAVMASVRKLGWLEKPHFGSLPGALDAWVRAVRAGMSMESRYGSDRYLRLRYEDLVADPETNLRRVCRFVRLDESGLGQMIRYYETADHEITPETRERYHPLIDQPVTSDVGDRWRSTLNHDEIGFIETAAAEEMARFGYVPSQTLTAAPKTTRAQWAKLRAQRSLRKLKWLPISPHPLADAESELRT